MSNTGSSAYASASSSSPPPRISPPFHFSFIARLPRGTPGIARLGFRGCPCNTLFATVFVAKMKMPFSSEHASAASFCAEPSLRADSSAAPSAPYPMGLAILERGLVHRGDLRVRLHLLLLLRHHQLLRLLELAGGWRNRRRVVRSEERDGVPSGEGAGDCDDGAGGEEARADHAHDAHATRGRIGALARRQQGRGLAHRCCVIRAKRRHFLQHPNFSRRPNKRGVVFYLVGSHVGQKYCRVLSGTFSRFILELKKVIIYPHLSSHYLDFTFK